MRKQIAICIGNNNYKYECLNKLKCAENDCQAMAEKLTTLNFDVQLYKNLNREEMHKVVDDFETALPEYEVALFYYAGHGFECNGNNLLMPIDTNGVDSGYRDWMALRLDYVIDALEGKRCENNLKTKIIILDACRQNSDGRGNTMHSFAPVFAPEGTIIAFSTSPGQKAIEVDEHGAYTNALLQSIDLPRIPIENMFKHVREILSAMTERRQISWEHTSLMGNYCFNEDRIDAFSFYSTDALADKNYYFSTTNPFSAIVEGLKSHDWYTQNPSVDNIITLSFDGVSTNDLFVLGRNIYQAATGGAWNAQGFVKEFSDCNIPLEARQHILNGMVYEMYYNRNGKLRDIYKSSYYIDILRLLGREEFQISKNFISAKLSEETNRIIYIPSSENKIEIHLSSEKIETKENGDVIHVIKAIYYQGVNVLYSADGKYEITEMEDFLSSAYNFSSLKTELAKYLMAPPDMIMITIDVDDRPNHYFCLPLSFSLRKSQVVE